MKGNDDKFGLYVVIAFLASIIIFAATFLIPIRSAFLQYVSGGVMITSFVCLLLSICKKLKESKEEKKYDNELSKTHSITRNPIDSKFYSNIIGKYKNSGSICFRKKSIKFFSLDNIYKIIKKYSNISSIENFNFKFFIDRKMNICQVYMRYGLIENTENFLDGLFNHLS